MRYVLIFFFNDTATTEIYTLSLHDALPICALGTRLVETHQVRRHGLRKPRIVRKVVAKNLAHTEQRTRQLLSRDRKSTRLNSSHANISYAVFCLKKKTISNTALGKRVDWQE